MDEFFLNKIKNNFSALKKKATQKYDDKVFCDKQFVFSSRMTSKKKERLPN